ncbi:hypothetical protein EYF80_036581 [Liparis tanakae]|uniref:Uncharacterized protein n=1 Tax=Liparis tanakae TaxID=230148 RepID=A0A4Z2GIV1_9TELE|nr:hypothetical protein EYF80_036581 [Liparis tanakae]
MISQCNSCHADVGGHRPLHPAAQLSALLHGTRAGHPAPEHLLVGLPEVLRQEGVDDGVDGGVAVGQAVSHHAEHEGGLVQGEGAELHPQVDDVVRQPGQAEDHDHHQDRLGRLRRERSAVVIVNTVDILREEILRAPGPARTHLGIADRDQRERQHVSEHEGAHHVDLPLVVRPDLPAEGVVVLPLHDVLVVRNGRRHDQGQGPDEHHPEQRVPPDPDRRGLPGVDDGHVAVHGHRRQREDADQHGHGEEVVDELADERAQHPRGQHVDGGLEGHAEEQVGQVRHAQVEDEDGGGAARLSRFAARQHRDHRAVAQHAEDENEAKYQKRNKVVHLHPQDGFSWQPHRVGVERLTLVLHLQIHLFFLFFFPPLEVKRSYMLMYFSRMKAVDGAHARAGCLPLATSRIATIPSQCSQ